MNGKCPVCDSDLDTEDPLRDGSHAVSYGCPRCGNFTLSWDLTRALSGMLASDPDAKAKLSHRIRRAQERNDRVLLDISTTAAMLKAPLPRPKEQADLLIRWIAQNIAGPGESVQIQFKTHGAVVGAKTASGFSLLLDHLFDSKLVTGIRRKSIQSSDYASLTLSFEGWDYYETLREGAKAYGKAFMAMQFGDGDLDNLLENVLKPSAKRAGFALYRLDDVPKAGLIDDRLRVEIQSSDFLIADLSSDNLGAYWEAGYAEGLGKPVIYTCERNKFESERTHFDTNHHLTIFWDRESPAAAGIELTATIRATLPHLSRLTDDDV